MRNTWKSHHESPRHPGGCTATPFGGPMAVREQAEGSPTPPLDANNHTAGRSNANAFTSQHGLSMEDCKVSLLQCRGAIVLPAAGFRPACQAHACTPSPDFGGDIFGDTSGWLLRLQVPSASRDSPGDRSDHVCSGFVRLAEV